MTIPSALPTDSALFDDSSNDLPINILEPAFVALGVPYEADVRNIGAPSSEALFRARNETQELEFRVAEVDDRIRALEILNEKVKVRVIREAFLSTRRRFLAFKHQVYSESKVHAKAASERLDAEVEIAVLSVRARFSLLYLVRFLRSQKTMWIRLLIHFFRLRKRTIKRREPPSTKEPCLKYSAKTQLRNSNNAVGS